MHPRELARRNGEANARINAAVGAIADKLGLDAPDFGRIPPRGGQEVVRLKERERQAEYLEQVADALGSGRRGKRRTEEPRGAAQRREAQDEDGAETPAAPPADSEQQPDDATQPVDQEAEDAGDRSFPPPVVEPGA